jgi:hypothetical protein
MPYARGINFSDMKVAILSACNRRTLVTEIFEERIGRAIKEANLTNKYSTHLVTSQAGSYKVDDVIFHPNQPLGGKWNALAKHVGSTYSPDYVMKLDSDDLVSSSLLEYIDHKINQGYDLIGLKDLYFYSLNYRRSKYGVCGYWLRPSSFIIGPARTCSARLFAENNWSPWETNISSGLDGSFRANTAGMYSNDRVTRFSLLKTNTYCLDIKEDGNINGIGNFNIEEIEPNELMGRFMGGDEIEAVNELKRQTDKLYKKKWKRNP